MKSIIVTGGASGIGKACVLQLVRNGHAVTIADRDRTAGAALLAELGPNAGAHVQFAVTDVSSEASVQSMVGAAVTRFGRLDAAINCAGVGQQGKPVHELSAAEWDACGAINLRGMFLCIKYQTAAMLASGGAIVAVSSVAAVKGLINSAEYCATKAGVTGLVRAAALDGIPYKIRVNALLPGGTDTPLAMKSMEMNPKLAETLSIPVERLAAPAEIAAGALWLISDEASYVTGTSLAVDGAMSIA